MGIFDRLFRKQQKEQNSTQIKSQRSQELPQAKKEEEKVSNSLSKSNSVSVIPLKTKTNITEIPINDSLNKEKKIIFEPLQNVVITTNKTLPLVSLSANEFRLEINEPIEQIPIEKISIETKNTQELGPNDKENLILTSDLQQDDITTPEEHVAFFSTLELPQEEDNFSNIQTKQDLEYIKTVTIETLENQPKFVHNVTHSFIHNYKNEEILETVQTPLSDSSNVKTLDIETEVTSNTKELCANTATEQDLLTTLDEAFNLIVTTENEPSQINETLLGIKENPKEVKELFAAISANYIKPVKSLILQLKNRAIRKEWIEICQPAALSLEEATKEFGLIEISKTLNQFNALLSEARSNSQALIEGDLRNRILNIYETMIELLPQTFVLGDDIKRSEGIIIHSLLQQIPNIGKITFDKLYKAGLTTLESYFLGTKEDIAIASGISAEISECICNKFKQYQEIFETSPVNLFTKLQLLIEQLKQCHGAYEEATIAEWKNPEAANDRRFYRQNRQIIQLEINVLLAQMEASELVDELQRISFEKRIEELQKFLSSLDVKNNSSISKMNN